MISFGATIILITQLITLATAGLSFWASRRNRKAIQEVHISINSRMDKLLAVTASASHAEGVIEGEANHTVKRHPTSDSAEPLGTAGRV